MRFTEVTDRDGGRVSIGIFGHLGRCSFCFIFWSFPWKTASFQIQLKNLWKEDYPSPPLPGRPSSRLYSFGFVNSL